MPDYLDADFDGWRTSEPESCWDEDRADDAADRKTDEERDERLLARILWRSGRAANDDVET